MPTRSALLLALPWALSAQEDLFFLEPPAAATITRVAVGAYDQAFTDGWGRWKGWTLEGTVYPVQGGPWQVSAVGFDRPEGKGAMFSAGKHLLLGEASTAYLGLGGGTNGDFLPRFRADLDLRIGLGAGWALDLAGAFSRFIQNQDTRMFQAGPAYLGQTWSISLRFQRLAYEPEGGSDEGGLLDLRFGAHDLGVWHTLRLAAGRGILESTATGGSLASVPSTTLSGRGGRFGRRAATSPQPLPANGGALAPLPQERLVSLTSHWPLTPHVAVKAEATWGERVATYRFWGGSLQAVVTF